MSNQIESSCISCGRTQQEVPLTDWRFQDGKFSVCPECLPMLIHHREQAIARWRLQTRQKGEADTTQ